MLRPIYNIFHHDVHYMCPEVPHDSWCSNHVIYVTYTQYVLWWSCFMMIPLYFMIFAICAIVLKKCLMVLKIMILSTCFNMIPTCFMTFPRGSMMFSYYLYMLNIYLCYFYLQSSKCANARFVSKISRIMVTNEGGSYFFICPGLIRLSLFVCKYQAVGFLRTLQANIGSFHFQDIGKKSY